MAQRLVEQVEVDVEVISLERDALLPRDEGEALAQLEEEVLDAIDDQLFELALLRSNCVCAVVSALPRCRCGSDEECAHPRLGWK